MTRKIRQAFHCNQRTHVQQLWLPVRNGMIYCSPACGGHCTLAAWELAWSRGRALAARLGVGWNAVVWENLGWHFKAVDRTGLLKVHLQESGDGWTAFLGHGDGGNWTGEGKTPGTAVKAVRKAARTALQTLSKLLEATS